MIVQETNEIRELTVDEIDAVDGAGFWGAVAWGLFCGVGIASGVIIAGMVTYAVLSD
jgi:hypothetical protein